MQKFREKSLTGLSKFPCLPQDMWKRSTFCVNISSPVSDGLWPIIFILKKLIDTTNICSLLLQEAQTNLFIPGGSKGTGNVFET